MGRGVHLPEESGGQAETKQSADGSISGLPLDRLRLVALLAVRSLGTGVADSDDVAQQTVIQILRRRDTLGRLPERELVAYVRKASRMHLLKLRRGSKRRATREEEWSRAQEWTGARPDELVDDNDVATKRLRLLAALPAELFRLISACDLSGEPLAAVAMSEGIPLGTAKSRLRRGRALWSKSCAAAALGSPAERKLTKK